MPQTGKRENGRSVDFCELCLHLLGFMAAYSSLSSRAIQFRPSFYIALNLMLHSCKKHSFINYVSGAIEHLFLDGEFIANRIALGIKHKESGS
jgi:hypothetical protein